MSTVSAATRTANVHTFRAVRLHHRSRWVLLLAALLVLVGYAAADVAAVSLWGDSVAGATAPSVERVNEQLARTAAAEERYYEVNQRYTANLAELAATGWAPARDVSVVVVSVGAETFCLEAGPVGGEPTAWLSQKWGATDEPCE